MTLTLRIVIAAILYIYVFRQHIPCTQKTKHTNDIISFSVSHCAISICQNVRYAMNVTAENVCDLVILGAMNFHGAWFFILVAIIVWQLTYAMLFPKSVVVRKPNVYVFLKRTRFFVFSFYLQASELPCKTIVEPVKVILVFPSSLFLFLFTCIHTLLKLFNFTGLLLKKKREKKLISIRFIM